MGRGGYNHHRVQTPPIYTVCCSWLRPPATVFSGPVIYCNVLIGVYFSRRPESASDEQAGTVVFPGTTATDEKDRGEEKKKTPEPLLFVLPFVRCAPCNFSTHVKIVHCAFGNLQRLP